MNIMKVIEYTEKYKQAFIDFNTEWIIEYFGFLEEEDIHTFETVDDRLANGAMIYVAVEDPVPLAVCMAAPLENTVWEICKLGSNKAVPHKGAGSAVVRAAMDWAISHGAEKLFLITNRKLEAAIHIYKKLGFKEVKLDDYGYMRGDIAFEYIVEKERTRS